MNPARVLRLPRAAAVLLEIIDLKTGCYVAPRYSDGWSGAIQNSHPYLSVPTYRFVSDFLPPLRVLWRQKWFQKIHDCYTISPLRIILILLLPLLKLTSRVWFMEEVNFVTENSIIIVTFVHGKLTLLLIKLGILDLFSPSGVLHRFCLLLLWVHDLFELYRHNGVFNLLWLNVMYCERMICPVK